MSSPDQPVEFEASGSLSTRAASSDGNVELTIVMPCLNEAETLETCILKALASLRRHNIIGEVVIGDNGSTDGSQGIARHHAELGKDGIRAARSRRDLARGHPRRAGDGRGLADRAQ